MNEENTLALSVQARILPLLEGKDGLIREVQDVEQQIMGGQNFVGSDVKKQQKLKGLISDYTEMQNDVWLHL